MFPLTVNESRYGCIMVELKTLILSKTRHPFVLADGRRFASLACAAHSVICARTRKWAAVMLPITNEYDKRTYDWDQCLQAMGPDNAEWATMRALQQSHNSVQFGIGAIN